MVHGALEEGIKDYGKVFRSHAPIDLLTFIEFMGFNISIKLQVSG